MAGLHAERPTSSGPRKNFMMTLQMFCGLMKPRYNSKCTGGSAAGRMGKDQKPSYKPRPKHPIELHIWGEISYRGMTRLCILDGIMNMELYVQILKECLVPFLNQTYSDRHCFMRDTDQKHTSRHAQAFFA